MVVVFCLLFVRCVLFVVGDRCFRWWLFVVRCMVSVVCCVLVCVALCGVCDVRFDGYCLLFVLVFVVCCLVVVDCCLLFVRCVLFVVVTRCSRWRLFVVRCMLVVVCCVSLCLLFDV